MSTQTQPSAFSGGPSDPTPHGGPRTEAGKATSSKNSTKYGLFAAHDFIRPGEQTVYSELDATLRADLAPSGLLEYNLVDEIRRAMWRLRRCGEVEARLAIVPGDTLDDALDEAIDPMESPDLQADKTQRSVDRARSQAHRLLHKCTAELRKLQTERLYRNESTDAGTDLSYLGLCDFRSIRRSLNQEIAAESRRQTSSLKDQMDAFMAQPYPPPPESTSSFCKSAPVAVSPQSPTPRNAPCPCGSGEKYKRCCGEDAPAVLHAA